MSPLQYQKPDRIWLKSHSELDERWLQQRIGEDPSILGLGELVLRDKERTQPRAGRLDLLLQDTDTNKRYEVEVQLGRTDEAHIIRTIEYWDIEKKRYPQYEHTAVIVAEDITGRFLNVISLFNGAIPLIAIQISALRMGDLVSLHCAKILDETRLGPVDEDEEIQAVTDRSFWEERASRQTLGMADEMLSMIRVFAPEFDLKYNKFYIGLAKDGQPNNFAIFRPKKDFLRLEITLDRSDEVQAELDESGLDVMDYDARWRHYRIRLAKGDVDKHKQFLSGLLQRAYTDAT